MKSYLIFAIVLTVAYIIYYAVIIAQELYGKKREEKTEEEVFDLDPSEEESVAVTESDTGFSVGGEQYETEGSTTTEEQQELETAPPTETPEEKLQRLKAKAEERMEETEPYLSDAFTTEEMYKAMVSGGHIDNRPDLAWKPIRDKL